MNIFRSAALVAVSVLVLGACAAPRPAWTPPAGVPTQAPQRSAVTAGVTATSVPTPIMLTAAPTPPPATVGIARVVVTLTDSMEIQPGAMTVPAAQRVTFVVTNVGKIPHEFTLGDAEIQDEHEQEMMDMGTGMGHDEDNAIAVAPGETKELTYTFDKPGTSLAGCHVPGHYPAGMKATITITS